MVRGAEYFAYAKELGIKEDPKMPEYTLGVSRFSGSMSGGSMTLPDWDSIFDAQLTETDDQPFTVSFYRMSRFRHKGIPPGLSYTITSPSGRIIAADTIGGPIPGKYVEVAIPADGETGQYHIKATMHKWCWAEIASSLPTMELSSSRPYFYRIADSGGGASIFTLLAPEKEKLRINLGWQFEDKRGGKTFGFRLSTVDGVILDEKRWAIPLGTVWQDGEMKCRPVINEISLDIPEAFRGQPVILTVAAEKWCAFEVSDLDYPWLRPGRHATMASTDTKTNPQQAAAH